MQPRPTVNAGHRMPRGGDHCDFCGAAFVARLYACRDYPWNGQHVFLQDAGRWAACEQCAQLIDRQQWGRLTQRVMGQIAKRKGLEPGDLKRLRASLRELHGGFRANLIDEGKALSVHAIKYTRIAVGDD